MRIAMTLLALSLTMSAAACKKKKADDGGGAGTATGTAAMGTGAGTGEGTGMGTGAGTGEGTGAGTGEGTGAGTGAGADTGDDTMSKKAGNCPSTVFGATTKADLKGKNIVLTITSDDKDAVASIQRRTEELLKEKSDGGGGGGTGGGGGAHDGKGSHGGAVGICPVHWEAGGKATSKKNAKGVVITITPKDKPDELKKVIDERITKVDEWVKANIQPGDEGNTGGVGGGKGEHGGNHSGHGDSQGKERNQQGGAGTGDMKK